MTRIDIFIIDSCCFVADRAQVTPGYRCGRYHLTLSSAVNSRRSIASVRNNGRLLSHLHNLLLLRVLWLLGRP